MPKKLTYEFVNEYFKNKDYILLSQVYVNCKEKLHYICPNNHKGSITFSDF